MAKFVSTAFIKRPAAAVWDYVANPARLAEWQAGTEHAEWTSNGQPGVGSSFKVVTTFAGKKMEGVMQISLWDPPQRHGFKSAVVAFPVKSLVGITTLTPEDGGTRLTFEAEVAASGVFKLLIGLLAGQVKKQDESNLATMKRLLEAEA